MDLIQFHSFSSAWYWFALIAIWAVFCQLYLGMSYHQLRLARQRHPERQGVLLRALALYLERMRWSTVSNIGPFVAGLCAFVLSFWSVVAFFYNVEILQAFFFLFVPLGPSLILRWRLARRLAKEMGVDIRKINGSGPHGRVIKKDIIVSQNIVINELEDNPAKTFSKNEVQNSSTNSIVNLYSDREYKEIPLSGMRKTVAARLTEAKQTVPHFYLRKEVKIDELLSVRLRMNKHLADKNKKLSINDFIIKACALALQSVPKANVVWADDKILQLTPSDIAVAVSVEDGLFTPIIRDAEKKGLSDLSIEMKELAEKARSKKLLPNEYQGGSFAISNLGMFGIDNFDAVINPPHGAILAVGAGIKKPIVNEDNSITVANVMSLTLSVDHRSIDGALGAELLQNITKLLEDPLLMLT